MRQPLFLPYAIKKKDKVSETILFSYQYHGNPSGLHRPAGDHGLAADTVITLAVSTETCDRAGGFGTYPDAVRRSCNIPYPADAILQIGDYFVHAGDDQYVGRAVYETGNPIADTIYIDQLPLFGDCVGTHKEIVGCNDFAV